MENKVLTIEWHHGWENPDQDEDDEADFPSDGGLLDVEVDRGGQFHQLTDCCRTNPRPVRILIQNNVTTSGRQNRNRRGVIATSSHKQSMRITQRNFKYHQNYTPTNSLDQLLLKHQTSTNIIFFKGHDVSISRDKLPKLGSLFVTSQHQNSVIMKELQV